MGHTAVPQVYIQVLSRDLTCIMDDRASVRVRGRLARALCSRVSYGGGVGWWGADLNGRSWPPGGSLRIPARRLRAPRMSVVGCGLVGLVVLSGTCRSLRKSFVRRLVAAGQGRVPGCSNALCACMSPPRECLSCVRDRLRLRLGVGCLRRINTVTVTVTAPQWA